MEKAIDIDDRIDLKKLKIRIWHLACISQFVSNRERQMSAVALPDIQMASGIDWNKNQTKNSDKIK